MYIIKHYIYAIMPVSFYGHTYTTVGVQYILFHSEYSPDLTWRDVQYLIAYTSNRDSLTGGEWTTNGAGLRVSHKFGFGAIDAEAMVTRARHWISVPEQHSFSVRPTVSTRLVCFFDTYACMR